LRGGSSVQNKEFLRLFNVQSQQLSAKYLKISLHFLSAALRGHPLERTVNLATTFNLEVSSTSIPFPAVTLGRELFPS
jgi:hypothetical protein